MESKTGHVWFILEHSDNNLEHSGNNLVHSDNEQRQLDNDSENFENDLSYSHQKVKINLTRLRKILTKAVNRSLPLDQYMSLTVVYQTKSKWLLKRAKKLRRAWFQLESTLEVVLRWAY